MNLLLDTHVALRAITDSARLSGVAHVGRNSRRRIPPNGDYDNVVGTVAVMATRDWSSHTADNAFGSSAYANYRPTISAHSTAFCLRGR